MKLLPVALSGLCAATVSGYKLTLGTGAATQKGKTGFSKERRLFNRVAGVDKAVDSAELHDIMIKSGGYLSTVSLDTCRIIISINDDDMSGKLEYKEFTRTWKALKSYANEFKTYDKNQDNQMDKTELPEAMLKKGYVGFDYDAINAFITRYSVGGGLSFNDYANLSVRIKALDVDFHKHKVVDEKIKLKYEDFIKSAIRV